MNARVLIIDGSAVAKELALLAAVTLSGVEHAEQTAQSLEEQQPEDTGLGFMEFSDWLASTSDAELKALCREHELFSSTNYEMKFTDRERQAIGLAVWQYL